MESLSVVCYKNIRKMNIILFLLILFCHSSSSASAGDGEQTNEVIVYDNTIDIDRLMYGDIIKMDDLYLPSKDNIENFDDVPESKEQIKKNNIPNPIWNLDDLNLPSVQNFQDIKTFNEITKSVRNITKNITNLKPGPLTRRYWYQDREDGSAEYDAYKFYKETDKKNRLINLMTTFIIHARYQIKKVVTARHPIREDKRYKVGYLCNTLKHLHYEQTKLVNNADMQMFYKYKDVDSLVKIYEKVIRADVDIIDTIALMKSIDVEPDVKKFLPHQF